MNKEKITGWAIVSKSDNEFAGETFKNRYWIYERKKDALKEVKDAFYNSPGSYLDKVVRVEIIIK